MGRLSLWIAFLVTALALVSPASRASARTSVSIDLHIGDAYRGPRLMFQHEPDVVIVPGTRVYYVRDYDYDLYRYGSFWYYNYDGGWYRARRYNGPFTYVGYRSVPSAVTYVPTRYRRHWRDAAPGRAYGRDNGRGSDNGRGYDNGHGNGHGHGNKHGG
jgi:hypothetical protein